MNKTVTFGEVMLRLATPGYERFGQGNMLSATYGGGEANVAVSLANYGLPVSFVTRVPDNDIAAACLRELRGFGVDVSDVVLGGDRLGIYFLETGAVSRGSKVIYDRAGSSIAKIEPGMIDWDKVLADAGWFHWTGITPAISEGAAKVCLEALKKRMDGAGPTSHVSSTVHELKRDTNPLLEMGNSGADMEIASPYRNMQQQPQDLGHVDEVPLDVEGETVKTLDETERETIENALRRNNGRRKVTAQELNISERTLYRKIKQYNLERP